LKIVNYNFSRIRVDIAFNAVTSSDQMQAYLTYLNAIYTE